MHFEVCGECCNCAKMWIDLILMKKAPAECQKFENKMADVANKAQEGEITIYWFTFINVEVSSYKSNPLRIKKSFTSTIDGMEVKTYYQNLNELKYMITFSRMS